MISHNLATVLVTLHDFLRGKIIKEIIIVWSSLLLPSPNYFIITFIEHPLYFSSSYMYFVIYLYLKPKNYFPSFTGEDRNTPRN